MTDKNRIKELQKELEEMNKYDVDNLCGRELIHKELKELKKQ